MPESVGVGGVGGVEGTGPFGADLDGGAVVERGGGVEADAGVAVLVVVVGEERFAEGPASWIEPKLPGNAGQYSRVLNPASL